MEHGTTKSSNNTPTKRQSRSILWSRGKLNYTLWKQQKRIEAKFQEVKARGGKFLFINISRRFGKTFWVAKKCIEMALTCANRNPRIKIGAAFYEDLQEFIIPSHEQILDQAPQFVKWYWRPSKKKYLFPKKKAEIKLVGLDLKPNGLRGGYADLIVIEECGFVKKLDYLYSSVCMPMTMYREGAMVIMIGTPPETPDHPFVQFQAKAQLEDCYLELTIDDNEQLTDKEKEAYLAECLTESDRLREYYCKCVVDETRAIIPEWRDEHMTEWEKDEFFKYYYKYVSMDLGVKRDQTVALFGYYDFLQATLVVEDEFMMTGHTMTTDKLAGCDDPCEIIKTDPLHECSKGIKGYERELWGETKPFRRTADSDNPLLLQDLASKHGVGFLPVKKQALHTMVNQLRIWVREGRVKIHPRCKLTLGCLKTGIWNEQRTEFDRSKVYGHYDALASLIYMVRRVDTTTNTIPDLYNMSEITHHIPEHIKRKQLGNVEAVREMLTGKGRKRRTRR